VAPPLIKKQRGGKCENKKGKNDEPLASGFHTSQIK